MTEVIKTILAPPKCEQFCRVCFTNPSLDCTPIELIRKITHQIFIKRTEYIDTRSWALQSPVAQTNYKV